MIHRVLLTAFTVLNLSILPILAGKTIHVKNSCGATVYPAFAGQGGQVTRSNGQSAPPSWELGSGGTSDLVVPDDCKRWGSNSKGVASVYCC